MATGNPANSPRAHSHLPQGIGFVLLLIIAAVISSRLITPLLPPVQHFTIAFTKVVGSILGMTMTSSDDILYTNGFPLRIAGECTALNYILILALAILLYARHSLLYRLSGIAAATGILLIVNAIRLIVLGLIGPISLDLTLFVHEYVWAVIFALLVFSIWIVWADREFRLTGKTIRQSALTAAICTVTFFLLYRFKESYSRLLAVQASLFFKLFSANSMASVIWDHALFYRQGEGSLQVGLSFEIITIAVYVGVMSPFLWRNRKSIPHALVGLFAIIFLNVVEVALLGVIGMNYGYEISKKFLFIGSGIFVMMPIAMHLIITGLQRKKC
ncbi:MAG: archaeosortase/exosortase family protein [Oryzomonas sp.]|uniref:archaeosortase/exosortase family protein n=1 Tax=Oryzomonas sp. TaxID=2855186 RepID=UPI0028435116|nr:archaeosortase/exosortase family protein [Oryzomonas sp.]MDR3579645.1 archaeosortase/exosortase family protein [Oryzomonas sp.]